MQSEEVSMSLKVLRSQGWSITALAKEFGLNWRTVKREVESEGPRRYGPRPQPAALTGAQLVHIERRLTVCPGIRGTDPPRRAPLRVRVQRQLPGLPTPAPPPATGRGPRP
jgi:hypothetical protein